MKIRSFWLLTILTFWLATTSVSAATKSTEELAGRAVSADPTVSSEAVRELRALGASGLDALFAKHGAEIARFSTTGEGGDEWKRIAFALDSVAMQKDAYAARLFWHTDLEEAKKAAAAAGKPILSLRLLGNLNEEFSCANSRFFRALLYSNGDISKYLRENYVLHWKSVRPAPKVTIDFGDGRKIERTLTGNSIHYILSENGEIIDALPGLYAPANFLKYLTRAADFSATLANALPKQKETVALRYRKAIFDEIRASRNKSIAAARVALTEPKDGTEALVVAPRAMTKMVTEASILRDISDDFSRFEPQIDLADWKKLAGLYAGATKFDAASVSFIKRQNAKTGLTDAQFTSLLANLTNYVALDTTRNDFLFHTKLCEWLNQPRVADVEAFNSRVYAELFKTPDSDKWLGLYNTDVYTALDGNGIIK